MNIGIICEGPTDYIILREIIDKITGMDNDYVQLQPEPDLMGEYGNGWKGVWKWCSDNADKKEKLMKDIEPSLDILIIQMDGDVSRKEKVAHCWCKSTICNYKNQYDPLKCDIIRELRENCPIILPCTDHEKSSDGCIKHIKQLIEKWLPDLNNTCIVVPCDSTEAWVVAAYDEMENIENVEDPWKNIIAKKKAYHNVRIQGTQKKLRTFKEFGSVVCENWKKVTELCVSAKEFENNVILLSQKIDKPELFTAKP